MMVQNLSSWLRAQMRKISRDERAAAAVEFAFVAPILFLTLGCVVDFGLALRAKFKLSSALSAASAYALDNASSVSSTGGAGLASTLATLIASSHAANWADASVVVNNGPSARVSSGVATASGVAGAADSCYCPTGSKSALNWGAAVSCGVACASGAPSGKFIQLTATKAYTPFILPSGLIGSPITGVSVVQVQ
ncbi:Flp pilus assembly protein TadG [Rhodoblastus acidophilus]|uniref:TadE/TadG family type IV pilus assembly protein n=1 Tax=Rhodoblastus acidophilus TaxID=1074 RepID=UPI002224D5BE|nr:TadE/TadG family type IV pilus assembly protein [Rhodoblastus acidophilus]MCW2285370.1 Flp pilus assembly protein TadG [Rhodoblastus acidophilus]MCW2334382.1 Flp pilus assembly protein TadG [Rhodoblastus acidophilus]